MTIGRLIDWAETPDALRDILAFDGVRDGGVEHGHGYFPGAFVARYAPGSSPDGCGGAGAQCLHRPIP